MLITIPTGIQEFFMFLTIPTGTQEFLCEQFPAEHRSFYVNNSLRKSGVFMLLTVPWGTQEFYVNNSLRNSWWIQAGAQPEDFPGKEKVLWWWQHFPWLCFKYPQHSHCSPLGSRAGSFREKKESKMSIQVGVFCRETAMVSTEKRESSESSPLFLDVRIALKLSVFV